MTVKDLIDFYLEVRQPGGLIGFAQLYEDEFEGLKQAIQDHYSTQDAWLDLPEETELPDEVARRAESLRVRFAEWMRG